MCLGLAINVVLKSPNALASCHVVRPAEPVEGMESALIQKSNGHIDLRLDQPLYTAPGMSIAVRAALFHRFLNSRCLTRGRFNTPRLYMRLLLRQQARSLMPHHYRRGSQQRRQSQTVALKLQCLLHHLTGDMAHRLPHFVQVLPAAHHHHTHCLPSVINYGSSTISFVTYTPYRLTRFSTRFQRHSIVSTGHWTTPCSRRCAQ